ncbi:ubiquinol-cytochrome c reductase iron-sulfur subunit [Streptomyces sp. NPDC058674]|uniref:QcrA and Rieske domain-containing protein n=1 Tax=Streptomyces sp. NPDC058674 TaxID=3346592 RepID=UPI0036590116
MSDLTRTTRRTVLAAGAATLAGGALAACGGESDTGTKAPSEPASAATPSAAASEPVAAGAKTIAKAADVPVGGGTVLKDQKLVITQPTAGTYRCFSAVCTHTGCLVNKVADGSIDCPCHGSTFKDTDGAVTKGPATRPLPERKITVAADGSISLA